MIQRTAFLTLALTIAFAAAAFLAPDFAGFREDQLPIPQIDPPIQPVGFAFAIWGLIYAWLIVSAVYGAWARVDAPDWHDARIPLNVSLAVGVPWLWIAGQNAIAATVVILVMAIGAILSLTRAPLDDRWLYQAPVGLYAGWLTAASFVSLATVLAGYGIAFDAVIWAVIGIAGAFVVATIVLIRRPNALMFRLAVVWALGGIIVANGVSIVSAVAVLGAALLLLPLTRGA